MKKRIEQGILVLLFLSMCMLMIATDEKSDFAFLSGLSLAISSGLLFFANPYVVLPKFSKGRVIIINGLMLLAGYFITAFLFAKYLADLSQTNMEAAHLIHPVVIKSVLPFLLLFLLLGLGYAAIRQLFIDRQYKRLKRTGLIAAAVIAVTGIGFTVKYQLDVAYAGDEKIRFVEGNYASLEDLLQQPQFKGKRVYVDLWYTSCTPCIRQFGYIPALKRQLGGQDVVFLYLARETSHQNSKQRWKNMIRKFQLQGYHFYMTKQFEENIWQEILANQDERERAAYPHYLVINEAGKVTSYHALKPSEGQLTVQQILTGANKERLSQN